jgi:hypothetical protein
MRLLLSDWCDRDADEGTFPISRYSYRSFFEGVPMKCEPILLSKTRNSVAAINEAQATSVLSRRPVPSAAGFRKSNARDTAQTRRTGDRQH